MQFLSLLFLVLMTVCPPDVVRAGQPRHITAHVNIYREPGRFAGWPANNGIWVWEDEIVVGFILGYHKEQPGHTIDGSRPAARMQARSHDGGETWKIEETVLVHPEEKPRDAASLPDPIDFTAANFAARLMHEQFWYSLDRCHTWEGPLTLPAFGRPGLLARTDYLVEGRHRLTAFIAAQKAKGGEGQPLCIRTTDGGRTWNLVGWIGRQPPNESYGYAIMPATVAINGRSYLSIIRRGGVFDGQKRWWLESFLSPDSGHSWYMLARPAIDNGGNPATLTRLRDGRLAMAYGWRKAPFGIRSKISADEGQTWSSELILRADGRHWDLGYPRTVQRTDGQLVTVYYCNDHTQPERYLAATIWDPQQVSD